MNTLVIVLIAAVVLFGAYVFYGRWLANKWGIDPKAKTPAVEFNDGKDFVPTNGWTVFSHQFSSIAGAGPVTGAIQAAAFGWLPVLLWVLIGGVFFGAVTDFGALYASVKNKGKSMGMLIEKYIGKTGRKLFLIFSWIFCCIVVAAFADMVAGTFNAYTVTDAGVTELAATATTNGAAGMISIMFMVFAVVLGLIQKKFNLTGWKEAVVGIVCIVASFAIGMNCPLIFGKAAWSYITFVYIFFAAVLPMWLLKQPRDYMTTFMFICMIAGAVVGLVVAHPTMNLPVFTGFTNEKLGTMFPILFVTVACGAVSGFHSLVSSGTSSKTIENEKDMPKVGYGAMVLESLLAVLALCVAGAAAAADGTPAAGTPFQVFSSGVAGFFEMFGVPVYVATAFMTMCVSALALTSLDAVARIGRMSFQELFSVDDMEHAEGWRKLFCNVYFSTVITLAFGFLLTKIGYANIWPLFGSANQLLSALVLITLCVFLKVTGRSNKMIFPPLIIMLCVTFTALVQRFLAMVKAISAAASTAIPAGETTWGAVFIANGLQLILAVLLIVLGLTIVIHSFKSYAKSERNSENA
ncbi:carbon starvation protein A [Butyricicoccus faecihominis]|uniref:Carbon starvation protein A n=3 Tax=Butyricicoccaceae TaxID=3085642 RepID=A0ABQ1DY99_9FIRM|nr:carbon starvation protein A [Butyricicoccus faecihominis]GFO87706.1 carbon starvation protein A [Butyricicoccus faecihominis]GGM71787.1 carbon starvation protein A [Butyricicoccus faecihominis]